MKKAFTLAEILITLMVIGFVAVLTLPNLIQNHKQKAWNTAADVFQKKLEVAARSMNTQEVLAGYTTTKDFVNELKKHIKITKICDNTELTKCFPSSVLWGDEQEEINISEVTSAKYFGLDWGTEVVGVEFSNGIDALIAYDPNCVQDPYNNQIQASNCMAVLYDTSARKNPNTYGKDLRAINIVKLGASNCAFEIEGICFSAPFFPTSVTKAECEVEKSTLGIKECNYDNDYWAGAIKACGGINKMPTMGHLAKIANYIYNRSDIGPYSNIGSGLVMDKDKVSKIGFVVDNWLYGEIFNVWSSEECNSTHAYRRDYMGTYTYVYGTMNGQRNLSGMQAICLVD